MPSIRFLKAERLSRDASYKNWTGDSTTVIGKFQHLVINTDMITTGCGDFLEIRRQGIECHQCDPGCAGANLFDGTASQRAADSHRNSEWRDYLALARRSSNRSDIRTRR